MELQEPIRHQAKLQNLGKYYQVSEIVSGQGLIFLPYLKVNANPKSRRGKSTFRRCVMEFCSPMISQLFVGNQGIALERRGSKIVLPACLLKMGVVFPEFCNSRYGIWGLDSVT